MAEKLQLLVLSSFRLPEEHQAILELDKDRELPHHIGKGTLIEVNMDPKNKRQAQLLAALNSEGRICKATAEMKKRVEAELAAEKKNAERFGTTSLPVPKTPDIQAMIDAAVAAALKKAGVGAT